MTATTQSASLPRVPIYYGWVIWGVSMLGMIATSPGQSFSVSLFNDHFIADFGLSRTVVSGLYGLGTLLASFSLTFVGRAIDRYGARRVGTGVAGLFSLVLVSLSALILGPVTLLIAFFLIRLLGQGSLGLVSTTSLAKWWRTRRGWVMGLMLLGFSGSQSIYINVLDTLIREIGWRSTWVALGLGLVLPIAIVWWLLMRSTPEEYGLLPDGAVISPDTDSTVDLIPEENWTLNEAVRTTVFWVFMWGRFMMGMLITALVFHQVSIFAGLGHSQATVADTFGLIAILTAVMTLIAGRIINWMSYGLVMTLQLGALITAMLLAMMMTEPWMLVAYATAYAVAMGFAGVFGATVWAEMFGRLHLGAINGFSVTVLVIGTSVGPVLFGFSFDNFQNYRSLLLGKTLGPVITDFDYALISGGYAPVLWLGIAVTAIPMVWSLFLTRPLRKE